MNSRTLRTLVMLLLMALPSAGMNYKPDSAVAFGRCWAKWEKKKGERFPYKYRYRKGRPHDCVKFGSTCAAYGGLLAPEVLRPIRDWNEIIRKRNHKLAKKMVDTEEGYYDYSGFQDYLVYTLKCPAWTWSRGNFAFPSTPQEVKAFLPDLRPGDFAWCRKSIGSNMQEGHLVLIVDVTPDKILYVGHSPEVLDGDLLEFANSGCWDYLDIIHIPNPLRGCRQPKYLYRTDSTFLVTGSVRHQWTCCWHENLANTWPWFGDSSAYACLSWTQSQGTTWDTLIYPRLNLAAWESVLLRQESHSNLLHGGGKTIELRGSTNDGATRPYLVGDDTLTEATLPWAAISVTSESPGYTRGRCSTIGTGA